MSLLNEKYLYTNACRFIDESAEVEQLDEVTMDVPLAVFRKLKQAGIDVDALRNKSVDELADMFAGSKLTKDILAKQYVAGRKAAAGDKDINGAIAAVADKIEAAATAALADYVDTLLDNKFVSYNKNGDISIGFNVPAKNQAVYNASINFAWNAIKDTMRKTVAPALAKKLYGDDTASAMNKKVSVIYEAIYKYFIYDICGKNTPGEKATAENFAGIKNMISHAVDNVVADEVVDAAAENGETIDVTEAKKMYVIDDSMLYEAVSAE